MNIDRIGILQTGIVDERTPSAVARDGRPVTFEDAAAQPTLRADSASIARMVGTGMKTLPVRSEKVQALQEQIASGRYSIDVGALAAAILDQTSS